MISYSGLAGKLNEKGMSRTALSKELGISSRTMAKIGKGEKVADRVLVRIAEYFRCSPADICCSVSENGLLQALRDEKSIFISGGFYQELQICMAYHSNRIEESTLSEKMTRMIFETRTIVASSGEIISVDDIIETLNHFRAIDYCIDHAEEPLTEQMIKDIHRILKQGTKDSQLEWFAVGDYKKRGNVASNHETAAPEEVSPRM